MPHLLREKYVFYSNLSKEKLKQALSERISHEPIYTLYRKNYNTLFTGVLKEDTFEIVRSVQGRNSFRPIINGSFESQGLSTTQISIKMGLSPVVLGIIGFILLQFFPIFGFFFIAELRELFTQNTSSINHEVLITFLLPLFFTLIFTIFYFVYSAEVEKAKRLLEDIFQTQALKNS